MSAIPNVSTPAPFAETEIHHHWLMARLSWGAIIAGTLVAVSLHLLLTMLALGLGLRMVNPYSHEYLATTFTIAAGVAWSVSALISLWVGGWVAGRTSGRGYGNVGGLHGVVVWSVATVASFTLFSGTVGLLAGGAAAAAGTVGAAAITTAANHPDGALALTEIAPGGLAATVASFLDEIAPAAGGVWVVQSTGTRPELNLPRARREIGAALYRNFSNRSVVNHQALALALTDYAGRSPAEAESAVRQWEVSYDQIKADLDKFMAKADAAARMTADQVSATLALLATWTFLMFGVGAFAAAWGGRCGGQRAQLHHNQAVTVEFVPVS